MDKLEKITYGIQNFGVFLVSIGIFPFMPDKVTDVAFFIGIASLLVRCIKLKKRPDFFQFKGWWPVIGMLVYVIILVAVSQFSPTVRQSSHVAYNYFKYMKASFEILLLMNGQYFFPRAVFYGLAIGTAGICLGTDNMIFQYFHHQQYYQYDLHRNMIADVFILMIPCTILYLTYFAKYLVERIIWSLFLVLESLTLYCTESRGAVLSLVLLGLLFIFIYCVHQHISKKKIFISAMGILLIIVGAFTVIPQSNHLADIKGVIRFESTTIDSYSEKNRIYLYQGTLNMIKEHPIVGVGLDNFNKEYVAHYMVKGAVERNLPHAHNFILAIFSTTGIVGFVGFLFMEWQFGYFFFKRRFNLNAFIGIFCLIVLLIHDIVDYSLYVYLICKLYWLILIACSCVVSIEERQQ
ncbi:MULTISPECIES: O-antigen ligase [Megasphaera]|uniref:O-antigen ligase family protein n=1 Tax=Megasphaera TaxID=906 RepID=UPI000914B8B9|nr:MULTISPECIES: O-antigen ligase family protein [Megasphaera]MCQ4113589.1 O-antigen ligase family protein [Megasphaera sp. SC8-1]SHJ74196.1 O-antigen ligase [Megasphaera elsdenii]